MFDAWTNTYYLPMYDAAAMKSRFIAADLTQGKITKTIDGFEITNFHQFFGAYDPICKKQEDGSLIVSYGKSYQWYVDGIAMIGATSQVCQPTQGGMYHADVTFSCGRKTASNAIAIDARKDLVLITIENNPMYEKSRIHFPNTAKAKHSLFLYNSLGLIVQSYKDVALDYIDIYRKDLSGGTYYFKLMNGNTSVGRGKLLVL